jgi:hypothetical protein
MEVFNTRKLGDKSKDMMIESLRNSFECMAEELEKQVKPFILTDVMHMFVSGDGEDIKESIRQIGKNLFERACKYIDEGKLITFEIELPEEEKGYLHTIVKIGARVGISDCIIMANGILDRFLGGRVVTIIEFNKEEVEKIRKDFAAEMKDRISRLEKSIRKGMDIKFVEIEDLS